MLPKIVNQNKINQKTNNKIKTLHFMRSGLEVLFAPPFKVGYG